VKTTTTRTSTLAVVALALAGLASAGCFSRVHLTKNHGRAYKQAFERQAVTPRASVSTKTPKGLDALESTIVVDTYRKGLGPQSSASSTDQMILVSPGGGGSLGYSAPSAPAPSK